MLFLNLYYICFIILFLFSLTFLLLGLNMLIYNFSLLYEWVFLSIHSLSFTYIVYIDWISMVFSFVVFLISSMVILYSSIYMGKYNYSSLRFLLLVIMFVFSMMLMVMSPNLLSILLGWDGLGLVSYCLVIYYGSMSSYLAGMVTCLINRLGDIGLLICIGWMFSYGSWNFLFYLDFFSQKIFWLIIFSSFTSSAQIPFSVWLPAAMAAPTPVSSLVHSSTLVTAGVYLLIRFNGFFMLSSKFFLFISLMTMTMSSLCANYEFDLKKIIALSTLSQLGLMMSSLFVGFIDLTFFHLLSHAMFKSLLFLCSGIIIHLMGGCQDIRSMGSICLTMPLTCCCFNISNMALCGFPYLSGFYSKDFIVESISFSGLNMIMLMLFYISLSLTSLYSIRLFYYSVLGKFSYLNMLSMGDNISLMKYSIILLTFFSVCFGSGYMWLVNLDMTFMLVPFYLKILTMFMVFVGLFMGYELINFNNMMFHSYYLLNSSMWFMYSYSIYLYKFSYYTGVSLNGLIYWGEFYGGLGLSHYLIKLSNLIQLYMLNSFKIFCIVLLIWAVLLA